MGKNFTPRISKKERKIISLDDELSNLIKSSDEKLLKGARLEEVRLENIIVKEQVRTKFNDDSIRELAENIKINGLIQPLVIHRTGANYTLICGERRFRAMTLVKKEKAPCYVLENKTQEELMAIQFSENSSREALHYIDKADGIYNYQLATNASERKIVSALGISKTEVHRSLAIAKINEEIKSAAKRYDIEKYVLIEFAELKGSEEKNRLTASILAGEITKRSELKSFLTAAKAKEKNKTKNKELTRSVVTATTTKILKSKDLDLDLDLDPETKKILKGLIAKKEGKAEKKEPRKKSRA